MGMRTIGRNGALLSPKTHKEWLRRFALPSVILIIVVIIWSAVLGMLIYRMLGVRITSVEGRPATFVDELFFQGLDGALAGTLLQCAILLFLFCCRGSFRWWLIAGLLVVAGTPIALYSGWHMLGTCGL